MLTFAAISVLLIVSSGCFLTESTPPATASEVEDGIFTLVNQERTDEGRTVLTRSTSLDALARDYAESEFSEEFADSSNLVYLLCNTWLLDFGSGTPELDEDTAEVQVDYCLGRPSMRNTLLRPEARETGVGVAIVGNIVYFAQVFDVIYSSGGDGDPIILDENAEAADPTWEELISFLEDDDTDENPYVPESFICGDYAEMLHNNAEDAGIRAAYVAVRLPQEPGHALNAFQVGEVIVFVDVGSGDNVAYMERDETYGIIDIQYADAIEKTTYAFYEGYTGPGSGSLDAADDTVVDFYIHW